MSGNEEAGEGRPGQNGTEKDYTTENATGIPKITRRPDKFVEIGRHLQRLRTESRWQHTIVSGKTPPFSKDGELSKDMEKQLNVRLFEKTKWVCLEKQKEMEMERHFSDISRII
jgi:hypothetical protein